MNTRCNKCGKRTKHLIKLEGETSQLVFGTTGAKRICPVCFKQAEHIANIMGGNTLEDEKEEREDLKTMLEEMQETARLKGSRKENKRKLKKFRKLNKQSPPCWIAGTQEFASESIPCPKASNRKNNQEKVKKND